MKPNLRSRFTFPLAFRQSALFGFAAMTSLANSQVPPKPDMDGIHTEPVFIGSYQPELKNTPYAGVRDWSLVATQSEKPESKEMRRGIITLSESVRDLAIEAVRDQALPVVWVEPFPGEKLLVVLTSYQSVGPDSGIFLGRIGNDPNALARFSFLGNYERLTCYPISGGTVVIEGREGEWLSVRELSEDTATRCGNE